MSSPRKRGPIRRQHAAARAEGTVIEITGRAPTLVVEYRTASGEVLLTESAGSDLYKGIALRDKLTVFYDPQHPSDARLDLFIENWLLPLLVGTPGVIILMAMLLITPRMGRDPFARPQLKSGGTLVQAKFAKVRVSVDMNRAFGASRATGSFTLNEQDGRYELIHNGQARDPYEPAVQRKLGLCFIVQAKWQDPRTGVEHLFESDPHDKNPERLVLQRSIAVYVDPNRPDRYRMELPFLPKKQFDPIIRT